MREPAECPFLERVVNFRSRSGSVPGTMGAFAGGRLVALPDVYEWGDSR
jgi:hypothetical protein